MKKYLFIALAALGFAACAEKVDDTNVPTGELEESYIAINLMAADVDTRAATDSYGYEEGTPAERIINSAYFFFFDENGNPFNVLGSTGGATAPGGEKNHLSLTIEETSGNDIPNVSDIKNAVLVLNTYKGIYPKQVVAILNWLPKDKAYSLDDLHNLLGTIGDDRNGYVMSNSVYMSGDNKMIDATPITDDNIKTSSAEALAAPINIYVERIAAKVVLTAKGKIEDTDNIYKVTQDNAFVPVGGTGATVYVQLCGWELYNDYSNSTILKNIDNWDVTTLGLTWNDIPYFRCYWADSQDASIGDKYQWSYTNATDKGYPTTYGFGLEGAVNYNNRNTYTYCGENTNQATQDTDPRTKVILKGKLKKKEGNNYSDLEIASWYGNDYAGRGDLKTAVANSLKYVLYSAVDGGGFTSIKPDDIECVAGLSGTKAYEVAFQLSTTGAAKTWYKRNSQNQEEYIGDLGVNGDNVQKTNEYLAQNVQPALVYEDGRTFYFVDIEHLGTAGAKYGVVRNHVYQIDINTIKGYGSPAYSGVEFIRPEYPVDYTDSYVAAKINVLSWKVVKQGVNVGQ